MGFIFDRGRIAGNVKEVRLATPGELDLVIDAAFVAGGWLRDSKTKYIACEEGGKRREVIAEVNANHELVTVDTTKGW